MRIGKLTLLVLSTATLTAACAGREPTVEPPPSQAAAPAIDVAGMYDFTATLGGQTRTGTLLIERTAAGYAGEGRLQGESEPALIDRNRREGQQTRTVGGTSG